VNKLPTPPIKRPGLPLNESKMRNVRNLVATFIWWEEWETQPYRFLKGTIWKELCIWDCKEIWCSKNIIEEAKKVYGEDKDNLNHLIEKSISLELEIRQKIERVDKRLEDIKRQKEDLERQEKKLKERYKKAQVTLEK